MTTTDILTRAREALAGDLAATPWPELRAIIERLVAMVERTEPPGCPTPGAVSKAEEQIATLFYKHIRLVPRPDKVGRCEECGEPTLWAVKPESVREFTGAVMRLIGSGT